jgi:hypothetical protein
VRNPFGPWTFRLHRVACQIVYVEHTEMGMVVDLVTLEPSRYGQERVPAGTPLALAFDARAIGADGSGGTALAMLLTCWEQEAAVVDLVIDHDRGGLRYELSSGHDRLVLVGLYQR